MAMRMAHSLPYPLLLWPYGDSLFSHFLTLRPQVWLACNLL